MKRLKSFLTWLFIYLLSIGNPYTYSFADIAATTLPTGGNVVSGNITISTPEVGKMNVNQTSNQGIVNWDTFNVGSSASVHFNQPTSRSSILNNVLSGQSIINGSIFSNGRLILVNPTGILTGPTSAIRSEGAILSTLNLTNQNYLNSTYNFSTNNNSTLINEGNIEGEYVALLSPIITNKGTINTNVATSLAAGDNLKLSISDSNLLTVSVNPSKIKSSINNEGIIKSQNGIVTLKTDIAQSVVDQVIKIENAKADGLISENGIVKLVTNTGAITAKDIKIDAGSNGASTISGTLNSNSDTSNSGSVEVTAKEIDINTATISADGKTGGGKVLIGGDWQGSGDLLQATYLNIDSNSKITANALTSGSGGTIVAWSDIKNSNSLTTVSGTLEAKGIDGSGGQIETSGADLDINGIRVNTSSVSGSYGNWLVDPTDLTIGSSEASTYASNLASTDVTLTADNTITLNNNISYSGSRNSTLTFDATTTVLNANITSSNGTLSIDINTILEIGATNTTFTTNGGNVDISGVIRAVTGENSNNFTINAGTGNVTFSSNVVKQVGDYSAGFAQGNFTSISDLDFSGTFLNAINIAGTATTIGDVTFQDGRASNNTSNANESFQHEIQNWNSRNYGNTGLNNIMKGIRWSGGTGHSPYVQFTNATAGQKYKIQALFKEQNYNRYFDVYVDGTKIVDDFRPLDAGSTSVNRGRYLTYQFEAASTNVMFRLSGRTAENSGGRLHGNDVNPILNAISIEAVDAGAAINNLSITANQFSAQAIEVGGDLTVTNSGGSTISGVISGDTALVKAGTSRLTTSANNTYTGGTTVNAGTLFGGAGSQNNASFGTGAITVASGAKLWVDRSSDGVMTNALTLNGGTLLGSNGFGQYWDGSITLGAHSTIEAMYNFYIDGVISGSSKNLTKTGNGNLLLRGNNTYTGSTTISAGTLTLSGSGNLGAGSYAGAIANSGVFKFDTSANLISTGVISGSGNVLVTGTGTYEPKATNTYTGGTVIDGGIIAAFTDRNWGALPGSVDPDNIILKNGGKAIFGSKNSSNTAGHTYWSANRGINLPTSGQQFIETGSGGSGAAHIQGVVNGIGGITFTRSGSKTIRFYGENTYTGDTKFNFTSGSNNNIEITPKAFQNSTVYLSPTRTNVGRGFSRTSGSGNIILGGLAGDMTDWRLVGGRNIEFGSNNANTSVAGGISRYAAAGNLIKKGSGTTTFAATSGQELNSSSIGLQIDAGKLVLNGDWGRSNTAAGTVAIAAGATLEIDTAQNNTYSGVLSGAGTLLLGGTGTSTFSGNNTFAGALNIADGGFKAGHANSFGSATITSSGGRISTASSITLPSLTVSGNVQLDSGITTTGAQIYNNNVVVKAGSRATPAEISTTNSDISFKGTLKGEGNAKARSLNIDVGTGNVLFGDRVGYAFNDEVVNINNTADSFYKLEVDANEITIKGDVMTYEEQIYNGDVLIGSTATNGTTRTFLSMDPKVEFNGTVNDTVKGKHTLIAKAIEIDRGANSIPVVNFNSTVGRSTALAGYNGLTGYQVINRNYGTINNSVPVGTKKGLGQTMGSSSSSSDNAKKAEKGANQITKILRNSFLDTFKNISFSGNRSIGFKKSVEIVYGDSSDFGKDINPKPRNNTQGFFNNFQGTRNNLATIKSNTSSNNDFSNDNFNKAPRDIKELFLKGPGGKVKASFLNPNTSKENPDLGACEVDENLSC
ncbi:filamentous hemagglutinin N-terminal domain-containing protein [Candidatus Pelagibacter sp. Uisw_121]|uniref:beta strand repeat-containing protein n=1 Tax=Candidatus Pelagibacter sp. Uisw_121 TaxID=3230987 RepID=UPI0039E89630